MSASSAVPKTVLQCAREFLGARNYVRTNATSSGRRKLREIAELAEARGMSSTELHALFARMLSQKAGLDGILKELSRPEKTTVRPRSVPAAVAAPATRSCSPAPVSPAAVAELRADFAVLRRHAEDMEELVRGLLERAVYDATRIKGLEAVVMAMATGSGIGQAAAQVYNQATRDYVNQRRLPGR